MYSDIYLITFVISENLCLGLFWLYCGIKANLSARQVKYKTSDIEYIIKSC